MPCFATTQTAASCFGLDSLLAANASSHCRGRKQTQPHVAGGLRRHLQPICCFLVGWRRVPAGGRHLAPIRLVYHRCLRASRSCQPFGRRQPQCLPCAALHTLPTRAAWDVAHTWLGQFRRQITYSCRRAPACLHRAPLHCVLPCGDITAHCTSFHHHTAACASYCCCL